MRMWEIRENSDYSNRDYKRRGYGRGMGHYCKEDITEAYECGYDEGYEEAYREMGRSTHGRTRKC